MQKSAMRNVRRSRERGVTLVELVVTIAVLAIIAGALVPIAKFAVKRQKVVDLRRSRRTMRQAIDLYKKFCDTGVIQKIGVDAECYPLDLDSIDDGVEHIGALLPKVE